jgi:hypothetical protein
MYQVGQNLYDDPNSDGFGQAVKISVRPVIDFPFPLDHSAMTFTDQYVQQFDNFSPLAVGTPHPYLKLEISGTVSVITNTDVVTGTATTFTSDFLPNDVIWLNGVSHLIASIDSDTTITLAVLYEGVTSSSLTAYRAKCYLTSEDGFNFLDNGIMSYNRNYASLPDGHEEFKMAGFTFPAYRSTSTDKGNPIRMQFNNIVVSKNTWSYVRTNDPETDLITLPKFEPIDSGGNTVNFVASDTTPTMTTYESYVSGSSYVRTAETTVSPWLGNIWAMLNIEVLAQ